MRHTATHNQAQPTEFEIPKLAAASGRGGAFPSSLHRGMLFIIVIYDIPRMPPLLSPLLGAPAARVARRVRRSCRYVNDEVKATLVPIYCLNADFVGLSRRRRPWQRAGAGQRFSECVREVPPSGRGGHRALAGGVAGDHQ